MRIILSLLALLLVSCASGHKVMSEDVFYEIPLGATEKEIQQEAGTPYAIHKVNGEELEYEYIERIFDGDRILEERHYFITIKDGKAAAKRVVEEQPSPFDRNSYDMQTSYK